jgi:hypothetical protein
MKKLLMLMMISFLLASCSSEPETIEVTRVVTEIDEVEVTRMVEVTRLIESEITRVVEVEVTREVEVAVESEVTRLVEVVVTATPVPVPEATSTTEAAASQESQSAPSVGMLQAMYNVRSSLETIGGYIDAALRGDSVPCDSTIKIYDRVANAPTFSTGGNPVTENAYNNYRNAVSLFTVGSRDLVQNCRDLIAGPDESGTIPFQQWGMSRQSVNDALDAIHVAIQILES